MPVQFVDRYKVTKEDWGRAQQWAIENAKRLGFICDKQISAITVYSSDEFWLDTNRIEPNPDMITLIFNISGDWGEPYLRSILFDVGNMLDVAWRVSETSGDPPESLEGLIEWGGRSPKLRQRAMEYPAFYELYTGIMQRLFPYVEHHKLHTDTSEFEEAKNPSHIRKELWRTDLLTRLQDLRFPPLEVEEMREGQGGVRVIWQPEGHSNYQLWFNLLIGDDPKVCVYTDPTLSGSTTGWLSTRLIKNEEALDKLPYTLEQWAVEDLRKKNTHPEHRRKIKELLLHHIPRDFEEVWGAVRRQLLGVRHHEVHTDTDFEESKSKSLTENVNFKPEDFEKLKVWAETTGGAVRTDYDEWSWGHKYSVWINREGQAGAKIKVRGKGGRTYIFHLFLVLDVIIKEEKFSVNNVAYIRHGMETVGAAYCSHENEFFPTLDELREAFFLYGPAGGGGKRSKLFLYSEVAYRAVKNTTDYHFQKLDDLYRHVLDYFTPYVEHHRLHTDIDFEESIMRRLAEGEEPPANWKRLTPEEVMELKPGQEVMVNYYGKISPAKWVKWYRASFSSGHHAPYALVIQPVDPVLLTDPMWDPKETEAEQRVPLENIGKEIAVEHWEVHRDVDFEESIGESEEEGVGIGIMAFNSLRPGDRVLYHTPENEEVPVIEIGITVKHLAKYGDNTEWYEGVQVDTGREIRLRPFDRYSLEIPAPPEHHKVHTDIDYEESFLRHLPEQFRIKG
jgi:hypothetical protein